MSNLRTRQIRTVPNWLIACGLIALLVAVPGLSGADSVLPLPQGVAGTRGPTPLRMGASLLQVESFATAMDQREVRTFYRRTLPSAGWRMDLLPWQASHVAAMQRMEETLQRSPNAPEAPALRARLDTLKATKDETLGGQLYATRGEEHVLISVQPADSGTVVFLNRWEGTPPWARAAAGGRRKGRAAARDAGSKPVSRAPLFVSVPRYPGVEDLSGPASESTDDATQRWGTSDATEPVAAYYRKQMARNGWKPVRTSPGAAGDEHAVVLHYQKPGRRCVVKIGTGTSEQDPVLRTVITVAVVPTGAGGQGW